MRYMVDSGLPPIAALFDCSDMRSVNFSHIFMVYAIVLYSLSITASRYKLYLMSFKSLLALRYKSIVSVCVYLFVHPSIRTIRYVNLVSR